MGRVEEAEAALNQALALEPENTVALANKLVLDTIAGRDVSGTRGKLEALGSAGEGWDVMGDLEAKREGFKVAMGKYSPKFEP